MAKQKVRVLDKPQFESAVGGDFEEGDEVTLDVSTNRTIDPSVLQGLLNIGAVELVGKEGAQ